MVHSGSFHAIVPAGGSGTRLWPLSRAQRPKFLLPLPGPRTMIQATVDRLLPLCDERNIMIMTGSSHADEVRRQLPELAADQVIVEPMPRGSGPAIGLGVAIAAKRDPDAIVGSFAADHIVAEPERFEAAVRAAIETARDGYLVTIGIQPSYPETGYGYICAGHVIGGHEGLVISGVEEFKEKPDVITATRYVESGKYLWNASMFVWKARTLLDEIQRHLPELASALNTIASAWDTPDQERVMAGIWPQIHDVTIDNGILERSSRVAVVPGDFGWTDLGDWHGFGTVSSEDPQANTVINAELLASDVQGAVVMGNGRLVALLGVSNIVVVDTNDALLVCDRSRAQEVRELVEALKRQGSTDLI
ncbi:MAG TPA: mannose-1-phosphate guanylyltransferase [Thermomicrobiales bacterium]|nr:mannose-1-phosphate guanylyltransferase [Thermomicrobiales bacterium]